MWRFYCNYYVMENRVERGIGGTTCIHDFNSNSIIFQKTRVIRYSLRFSNMTRD